MRLTVVFLTVFAVPSVARGEDLPVVTNVEHQPLAAQILRVLATLEMQGDPLPATDHTNPIFVVVGGQPIRASRKSAEWCLKAVDQC
jgi:hypothetical protein